MSKQSAGILLYRFGKSELQIFLVHPGGPFWSKKEDGAWSIPKGEFGDEEDSLVAANREFFEETGFTIEGNFIPLAPLRQKGGKLVTAFAIEGSADADTIRSNEFEMEWPPKSGRKRSFPEVDRAGWFSIQEARNKILAGQIPLIDELEKILGTKNVF
ncbi:MAG TPA: NUDIX domain-containing protein [Chitinophagales bacterium]|nr:NUDIX domain-containing protein [Chitinophagales bacterium]